MHSFPEETPPSELIRIAEIVAREADDGVVYPKDVLAKLDLRPSDFNLAGTPASVWFSLIKSIHAGRSATAGFRAEGIARMIQVILAKLPGNNELRQICNDLGQSRSVDQVGQKGVFLSYSSKDKADVDQLYEVLEKTKPDFQIFKDDRSIQPGENWLDVIRERAGSASLMVCWITPNYLDSAFCNYEVGIAQARGVAVCPVFKDRLMPSQMPAYLHRFQGISFSTHEDLVRQIAQYLQ